ncbi:MAG TPA: acetyl-CoA carboxylase biotin carboxyl carrier protein [Caulobacteraceae bacterium]|nr:acetyl-CoA carboxylase biotin carboxyl carrier protein [Caulobacteraceae bacterium]
MSDSPPNIDTRLIRRLAAILAETGLTEIEVEQGGLKIRVAREITIAAAPQVIAAPLAAPAVVEAAPASAAAAGAPDALPAGEVVKSPMVGTIYLQSEPSAPAFVKVGDTVSAGQTLLIVEAMKTMNAIAAPKAGVVRAVLVADGQPVQYGEPLAVID